MLVQRFQKMYVRQRNAKFVVILQRFQKMYEAEEVESAMEKKQLATLHQQRVQAELNERREQALDRYVETIDDDDTDVRRAFLRFLAFPFLAFLPFCCSHMFGYVQDKGRLDLWWWFRGSRTCTKQRKAEFVVVVM